MTNAAWRKKSGLLKGLKGGFSLELDEAPTKSLKALPGNEMGVKGLKPGSLVDEERCFLPLSTEV